MPGPFKFHVEFNWQNQGFSEDYFSNVTDLVSAIGLLGTLGAYRAAIMPKDPTFYIWGIRITDLGTPNSGWFQRLSLSGTYTPQIAITPASPWDAWLYEALTAGGFRKVQEIRGIPKTLTGIVGNVPIPNDEWLKALTTFRTKIASLGFGIYHSQVPAPGLQIQVDTIVPNATPGNTPVGALVVTTHTPWGLTSAGQATVVFRNCRCQPKLASRHVGVWISNTSFYLKNTNEGQIAYAGGGRMFVYNPTVVATASRVDLRSATRKVGRAYGTQVGRKLHRV